jgi:hypothetical protein
VHVSAAWESIDPSVHGDIIRGDDSALNAFVDALRASDILDNVKKNGQKSRLGLRKHRQHSGFGSFMPEFWGWISVGDGVDGMRPISRAPRC